MLSYRVVSEATSYDGVRKLIKFDNITFKYRAYKRFICYQQTDGTVKHTSH